jgi:hypothetical protein
MPASDAKHTDMMKLGLTCLLLVVPRFHDACCTACESVSGPGRWGVVTHTLTVMANHATCFDLTSYLWRHPFLEACLYPMCRTLHMAPRSRSALFERQVKPPFKPPEREHLVGLQLGTLLLKQLAGEARKGVLHLLEQVATADVRIQHEPACHARHHSLHAVRRFRCRLPTTGLCNHSVVCRFWPDRCDKETLRCVCHERETGHTNEARWTCRL